jgi:hypothetical protein
MTNVQAESMGIRVDGPALLIYGPEVGLKQMPLVLFTNSDPIILHTDYDIYKILVQNYGLNFDDNQVVIL